MFSRPCAGTDKDRRRLDGGARKAQPRFREMKLHFHATGAGRPLVVLHGLFGSGDNWQSVARRLGGRFRVITADLRNHGRSPHAEEMGLDALARDVGELLDELGLPRVSVLGHSLGGKVAMRLALGEPERVEKLIAVDIAPRRYPPWHRWIIDALRKLDLPAAGSRTGLDAALAPAVTDAVLRRFLLKSVERNADGGFRWRLNLEAIDRHHEELCGFPEHERAFTGPALFLRGGRSDYVTAGDEFLIRRLFPNARIATIQDAGHWVHAERPDEFCAACREFLGQ